MHKQRLIEILSSNSDEYLEFGRVQGKITSRPDLHAFLLLDNLDPSDGAIVDVADHDKIWLGVDIDKLASTITEPQAVDLIRCGVMWDEDNESLCMFA